MGQARYQMLAQIGQGGMGRIYRAHDNVLGRDVAIKLIEELHGSARERFIREARAAARLLHPNIAVVHDVDPDAGWLVMELVEGESLRARAQAGPLPPELVARIAVQMFSALAAAHDAGIVHRDIKPANIMLGPDDTVKLVDFGIARLTDVDVTATGDHPGTPAYAAPEQLRGAKVDARTDLYSAGATLYELVMGERLTELPAVARLEQVCTGQPALAPVILRCLQANPSARFGSAREALAALGGKLRRRVPIRWLLAAAAGLAIIGGSLAQRGEDDKALELLADYLAKHKDDPDAQAIAFLAKWWQGSALDDDKRHLAELPVRPAQRAMIGGIDLITQRRDPEAIAYLEAAARETPEAVEIVYTLGEAQWHGGRLEDGANTLAHAFTLDPSWEMALHHVEEFRLSRGETRDLGPIAAALHAHDPPVAAVLDCKLAVSERDYPRAVAGARAALARTDLEKIPELYVCLAQAQALAGDIAGGAATAKTAFELWPLEAHDRGGFAQYAEFFLYRGDLDGYLALVRGNKSSQRALALLYLRPTEPVDEPEPAWPGARMAPLGAATWILQQQIHGQDASRVYESYPEPEVRAWGLALAAEAKGDRDTAIARLREALAVPAKGDIRMLVAHRLAKLLHESGDTAGAATMCDEVIRPRFYVNYRAVLLPDCVAWSK